MSADIAILSRVADPVTPVVVIPTPVKPRVILPVVLAEGVIDEIVKLRKLALELEASTSKASAPAAGAAVKKRAAVYDGAKQATSTAPYEAKVIEKPSFIRQMLLDIVAANILFSSYTYDEHSAIVDAFGWAL